ncbi:MAG TPA: histidine--tRNA ligase [Gemmatimonadales bacterium]|jgi:histidyl-tRNA synthetase
MISKGLPGFRDFFPEEFALRAHIFRVWREVASRYGFEEYDGPPLEPLDLYTTKSGDEIVGQLYNFTDKGDREVALRPEMTPTLARMVGARANGLKKPIRWFSIPQLFRYERQQRGRLREHFQLNCDLLGEAGPLADAEIIALAIDMMRAFGLGPADVRVKISDRRTVVSAIEAVTKIPEATPAILRAFDRLGKDRAGAEAMLADELTPPLMASVLSLVGPFTGAIPTDSHLGRTIRGVEDLGLGDWLDVDMTIVRGLAYYTGTVFELFDAKGELRAICGGGRYDNLLASLGGSDLPAVGFGMGDVVLGELLKDRGLHPAAPSSIEVFVASVTPDDVAEVLRVAHLLRDAGIRVEYAFTNAAVGKQLTLANTRGARVAVVIGPDDRARNEAQIKDLKTKTQESVSRSEIVARVSSLVSHSPINHG